MKYIFALVIALLVHVCGIAQPAELGIGAMGLVVSDISESERFYVDILGMVPSGGFELSAEWSEEAGMAGGHPFAVKSFRSKESETATILKLAYFDNPVERRLITGIEKEGGVNYITFYYDTLTDVKDQILKAGIPIVGEVERPAYKILIIRDPDGVFVELIELKERK